MKDLFVPTAEEFTKNLDLSGKVAIVTGANTGIGKEVVRVLALRNAHVILGSRSLEKGEKAKKEILKSIGEDKTNLVEVIQLDLSNFKSVHEFVNKFKERKDQKLHYLFNNAGIFVKPEKPQISDEGQEIQFSVHHLSHYLLTGLLLPYLIESSRPNSPSRVIVTSSSAQIFVPVDSFPQDFDFIKNYNADLAYFHSKLVNLMFSNELNQRMKSKGVISNSLHPGLIKTDIFNRSGDVDVDQVIESISNAINEKPLSIEQGAATTLYAAFGPGSEQGGQYYSHCQVAETNPLASRQELLNKLFDVSAKLTGVTIA